VAGHIGLKGAEGMNRMLETRIARLEARAPDATADRPWVSIIVDEGEDAEEAQARYFAAHPEHAGCNVIRNIVVSPKPHLGTAP
jgi:hypothetical protein